MKIEYETTMADLEAWWTYSQTLPAVAKVLRRRALSLAISPALVIFVLAFGVGKDWRVALVPAAILFLVVWPLAGKALRHEGVKQCRRAVEADPTTDALGLHTLEATPEGLTGVSQHSTAFMQWVKVHSLHTTPTHTYLLLRNNTAYVIPESAFPSQVVRDEFLHQIRTHLPA